MADTILQILRDLFPRSQVLRGVVGADSSRCSGASRREAVDERRGWHIGPALDELDPVRSRPCAPPRARTDPDSALHQPVFETLGGGHPSTPRARAPSPITRPAMDLASLTPVHPYLRRFRRRSAAALRFGASRRIDDFVPRVPPPSAHVHRPSHRTSLVHGLACSHAARSLRTRGDAQEEPLLAPRRARVGDPCRANVV